MKRTTALRIRTVLDDWLPPKLRDSRLLSRGLGRAAFGTDADKFVEFRETAFRIGDDRLAEIYEGIEGEDAIQGETDLNEACTEAILADVVGTTVLEAGSGRGFLLRELAGLPTLDRIVGIDLVAPSEGTTNDRVEYVHGSVTELPFADNEFDTVVCTHVLEHIPDVHRALAELRRVARDRLIIVVPRERPYRWGFNLHIHFFPYQYNVDALTGSVDGAALRDLGDWYYVEPGR